MPTSARLLTALLAALVVAAVALLYVWRMHRTRLAAQEGVRALAAMRWHEFSQFVLEALQQHGFDAQPLSPDASPRQPGDLLLTRDNRSWLLTCKQSVDFVVTAQHVDEMVAAARRRGAVGGVIVTLGRSEVPARDVPAEIEVLDGAALWRLTAPLLPQGLQEHVADATAARARRISVMIAVAALAVGLAGAFLPGTPAPGTTPAAAEPSAPVSAPRTDEPLRAEPAATAAVAQPDTTPAAPVPLPSAAPDSTEDAQREQVVTRLQAAPGIASAQWSSRSTLLVVPSPGAADPRPTICAVVEQFETLRASRIQVDPASGSADPVRFFHCRAY